MRIKNNRKGITLIVLIITIIILLILAGISINALSGENGLFSKSKTAKEEDKKAEIVEYLNLKLLGEQTASYDKETTIIIENTRKEVKEEELKKYGKNIEIKSVEKNNEEVYFYVIVDDGTYKVSLKGAEYIGKRSTEDIELQEGDIEFIYEPTEWTNGKVKVEIKANKNIEGYNLEYKTESNNTWTKYVKELEIDKNQDIYARLSGVLGQTAVATGTIANIDKQDPTCTKKWYEKVDTDQIILYIQAADSQSGVNRVQCSVSTASGSYNNWKMFDTNWDSEKNAYKCIITPSTFGHFGQNYLIYLYVYDNVGNGGKIDESTASVPQAIALVNSTYYSSVTKAIAAISSSGTITMINNTSETVTFPSGKNITFNQNGKTLSGYIKNQGTLTLYGGTLNANGQSNAVVNTGTFNFLSGTMLTNGGSTGGWTLYNSSGTINMSGGTVQYTASDNGTAVMNNGRFNMSSGTITSNSFGLVTRGGTTNVTGGNIQGKTSVLTDNNGNAYIRNTTISGTYIALEVGGLQFFDCNLSTTTSISGPVIEVVRTGVGFNVYYYDQSSSRANIQMPIWTAKKVGNTDQDDLVWHDANVGSRYYTKVWCCEINKARHNNETGRYIIHIYTNGNQIIANTEYTL